MRISKYFVWVPLVVLGLATPASAADRMTDRELQALFEQIDQSRDRFEDALPGELKSSIIRGATAEVDVSRFLDDFQRNIDLLKERMKDDYSASAEVATVLRQGTSIDRFFKAQPAGTRGASEWDTLMTHLKRLAGAYGTAFPLPQPENVRRVARKELETSLKALEQSADQFKNALDQELRKDKTLDSASRNAIVRSADDFKKDAEALRSRVGNDEPSTAEADRVLTHASGLQKVVTDRRLVDAGGAWSKVTPQVRELAGVYGVAW